MPTITSALPEALQALGIAKEVTPGTPVAPAYWLSPKTITAKDNVGAVDIEGLRGSMGTRFGVLDTIITGSVKYEGNFYPDMDGFALMGILGDLTETGASAPYTHAASLLNSAPGQPHSYTLTHQWGATDGRQRAFCIWDSVEISFTASGVITISASATTFGSSVVAPSTPSNTVVVPLVSWLGTATLGGAQEYTVFDGKLTIKRQADPIKVLNGTQIPGSIFGGTVDVTGSLSFVANAGDTEQIRYLANTQPIVVLNFTSGTGATETELNIQMSQVAYKDFDLKTEGSHMAGDVTFAAVLNPTDAGVSGGESPCKITLLNAIPSGVY